MTEGLPSLVLDADRRELRDLVDSALDGAIDVSKLASGSLDADALWHLVADDLGVGALSVPAEHGGEGAEWLDVGVVAAALGAHVAPVPHFGRGVLAPAFLESAGWPAALDRAYAVVIPGTQTPWSARDDVRVHGTTVSGTVDAVVDAVGADALIVPFSGGLGIVEANGPGVQLEPLVSFDESRPVSRVSLDNAPIDLLVQHDVRRPALEIASTVLAMELAGLGAAAFDMTVGYVRERRQFGRTIASYQAVKHRLADGYVSLQQATAVARFAVQTARGDARERSIAASLAKSYCSDAVVRITEELIQLHGGIGFTWEHPAHRFLKRAKASFELLGTPRQHRRRLAALVLEGGRS